MYLHRSYVYEADEHGGCGGASRASVRRAGAGPFFLMDAFAGLYISRQTERERDGVDHEGGGGGRWLCRSAVS